MNKLYHYSYFAENDIKPGFMCQDHLYLILVLSVTKEAVSYFYVTKGPYNNVDRRSTGFITMRPSNMSDQMSAKQKFFERFYMYNKITK
tara:strand:- start:206 stop:472 length:267 start_codon:yes stop_codon:yes gene_type:complete